jgi:hypothetical protein
VQRAIHHYSTKASHFLVFHGATFSVTEMCGLHLLPFAIKLAVMANMHQFCAQNLR